MFATINQNMSNQLKPIYPMKKGTRPDFMGAVKILAVILFISAASSLQAARYFWVGGSGNWTDLSHWAATSGGSELHQSLPGKFDDVIFDANSGFAAGNNTVTLDADGHCKNMDFSAATNTPIFTDGANDFGLSIHGNLTLATGMTFDINIVVFDDLDTNPYWWNNRLITVTTNGVVVDATCTIDGGDHIRFADNFNVAANDIWVNNWNALDVRNVTVSCRNLYFQSSPFADLRGTVITASEAINISGFPSISYSNTQMNATTGFTAPNGATLDHVTVSGVPSDNAQNVSLNINSCEFNTLTVNMGSAWSGNMNINAGGGVNTNVFSLTVDNASNNVYFSGDINVRKSGFFSAANGIIRFDNGSYDATTADSTEIAAGTDLRISPARSFGSSWLILNGSATDSIYVSSTSAGNAAPFYAESGNHCFDHVVFTDIDATWGENLNAPLTADNGNNFGITFAATCGDTVESFFTNDPSALNICEGTQFTISYSYAGPVLHQATNVFILERSDDQGRWVNDYIDFQFDSIPTPFTLNMPSLNYNASSNYRFRVLATDLPGDGISVANPTPVQLGYTPYAYTTSSNQNVTPDIAVTVGMAFDGLAPFTYTYTDGNSVFTTTTNEREIREYSTFASDRTFEILSVFNTCGIGSTGGDFDVDMNSGYDNEYPSITMFGDTTICRQLSGGNDELKVWASISGATEPTDYEAYFISSEDDQIYSFSFSDIADFTSMYPEVTSVAYKPIVVYDNNSGSAYLNVDGLMSAIVNERPVANISLAPNAVGTICQGSTTDLQIDFTAGTSPWNVTYDDGGSPITISGITANPFIFSVSPYSNTTYDMTTNFASVVSGTCASELNANGGAVSVGVQTPGTVSLLTGDSAITYCTALNAADTFKLIVRFSGGNTGSYSISLTDGTNNFAINGYTDTEDYVIPMFPTATTTYTITGVGSGGACPNGFINAVPVVATVTPQSGSISAAITGAQSICASTPAMLTVNVTGALPATIVVNHGGNLDTITGINTPVYNLWVAPTNTTNYSILSVRNNCGIGTSSGSPVTVTVNNTPVSASFQVISLGNDTYRFVNTSSNATSYTWNFGDGTMFTTSVADTMHTYAVSGIYQVSLTASNECNAQTSVQTVSAATSVANALESAVINVYPNPSNGMFFLEVSGAEQAVNISIENIQGQVVYEGVNTGNRMELDIRNQSAGVYMLHLSNEQGRVVRKLIVQ